MLFNLAEICTIKKMVLLWKNLLRNISTNGPKKALYLIHKLNFLVPIRCKFYAHFAWELKKHRRSINLIKSIYIFFFVTKRILFRESFFLSPLMVKLKIRVTPNDHRFALLCHCRAVGTGRVRGLLPPIFWQINGHKKSFNSLQCWYVLFKKLIKFSI